MNSKRKSPQRAATQALLLRLLYMFVIVAAAVGAYFGLAALESAKTRYDGERAAPLVIVDKEIDSKSGKPELIELSTYRVKDKLPKSIQPYIDRIKHQTFRTASELLDRLNEEINAGGAAKRRKFQDQIDSLSKSAITEYSTYVSALIDAQKNHVNAETIKGLAVSRDPSYVDATLQNLVRRHEAFESTSEDAQRKLQEKIAEVENEVSDQIRIAYTDFKPRLLGLIAEAKASVQTKSALGTVLNEKAGSHVIYQTIWLACVVMLVFGVLYVILKLLQPLPPFAGGTEALTEQAKSFLTRRGGSSSAPEFARTFVVTAAALGIGTAVVVGGGISGQKSRPANGDFYVDSEGETAVYRPNNRNVNNTNWSRTEFPPLPEIPAPIINLPPIEPSPVYYSSINRFAVPAVDETRINQLSSAVNQLTDPVVGLEARMRNESASLRGEINAVDKKFGSVDVPALSALASPLPGRVGALETAAGNLRTEFFNRLNATSGMVEEIRSDNLERFRTPEGRNLFTRFKQIFGDEKFVVSQQTYRAVKNYMCRTDTVACSAGGPCACAGDPTKTCKQETCSDPNARSILEKLAELINHQPMTKGEFLGNFSRPMLKPWESLILRYTRVPY